MAKKTTKQIKTLEMLEKEAIEAALKITKGNISRAADALGIGRGTLYRKIQKFELDISRED